MNKITTFAMVLSFAVALAFPAVAATSNIAMLDVVKVLNSTNAHKRALTAVKKKTTEAKAKLEKLKAPLLEERKRLDERRSMLSQDKYLDEQSALRKKISQFKTEEQSLNEGLQREILKHRKIITDAVNAEVSAYAKEKKLDAVMASNVLLYSKDSIDISDEILKRVNARLDK